jgi:hypothetical protein
MPMRGAIPTPRSVLAAAVPHAALGAPPTYIVVPKQISMWGNDVHGDCVTAEEAFAKSCHDPEIFISVAEVISWATAHGVLEGANLPPVMTWMQNGGFSVPPFTYDDGPHYSVDWTNAATLQSAISRGPVKIGIAADQIETAWNSTGGQSGWFATGFHADANEDHCVSLCGYGSISWLAQQLGVEVPAGITGTDAGYAMFTWDSIGIIDVPSMIAITHEAWLRQPTTVIRSGAHRTFQPLSSTEAYVLGSNGNLWLETGPWGPVPPPRHQVDGNVTSFQALSATEAYVLGSNGNLWLETGPWGPVPPPRHQVDGNVTNFQALSATEAYVLGSDGNLWLETGPWGTVPPPRHQVDGNVIAFQALSPTEAYVLGSDGNLWLETGPWGTVPPARQQVDGNVIAFQALSATEVFVLGSNGNLWHETGPWGHVPPARQQVDGDVATFQAISSTEAYVLGSDGKLWLESGPWGPVPPPRHQVDGDVAAFRALSATEAYVLGSNGNLWHETGPWGAVPPPRQQVDGNVAMP